MLEKDKLKNIENCPICNFNSIKINEVKTIHKNSEEKVSLMQCLNCNHWFINPMPKQDYLNHLYEIGSEFVVEEGYKGIEKPRDKDIKKFISRFIKKGTDTTKLNYLEIGVGPGHLYNYFKKITNIFYGVDPCTYKPDDICLVSDVSNIPKNLKFDIIVIQDVLEHLEDPIGMLKTVKELSNSSAVLSLSFPKSDSLMAKLYKEKWSMVRPLGHLHYFSAKSIKIMLEKTGWKITKIFSYWPAPSPLYYIKSFKYKSNNPLKLIFRIFRDLLFKQLLIGRDQWFVFCMSDN